MYIKITLLSLSLLGVTIFVQFSPGSVQFQCCVPVPLTEASQTCYDVPVTLPVTGLLEQR